MSAVIERDFVVVLMGMRTHKRSLRKWGPAFRALPRMLKELAQHPESGFLGDISSGLMTVQYWRFFEHLEACARSQNNPHWPNWVVLNKRKHDSRDDVGVWHETYHVRARRIRAIYREMFRWGFDCAGILISAAGQRDPARGCLIQNKVADLVSPEKTIKGRQEFVR